MVRSKAESTAADVALAQRLDAAEARERELSAEVAILRVAVFENMKLSGVTPRLSQDSPSAHLVNQRRGVRVAHQTAVEFATDSRKPTAG